MSTSAQMLKAHLSMFVKYTLILCSFSHYFQNIRRNSKAGQLAS